MATFPDLFAGSLLRLSSPHEADKELLSQWSRDDEYMRHLDDDPIRPMGTSAYDYVTHSPNNDSFYFHLRTVADDKFIGFVVLFNIKWSNQTAEMAIAIGDTLYRGKGYGQEALKLLLNYGFNELNLHRIGLTVISYNTQAIKAYERAGFTREGAKRNAIQRHGQRYDMLLYAIIRDEFVALHNT